MTRRAEPIDRQTRSILPHARSQKGRRARGRVQVPVRPVCRAARTMLMIVTAATAILCGSLVSHAGSLLVATDPSFASALGQRGSDALVLLFMNLQKQNYYAGQIFFGLWLLPLGFLVYRSGWFPKWLGVLLAIGCFSQFRPLCMEVLDRTSRQSTAGRVSHVAAGGHRIRAARRSCARLRGRQETFLRRPMVPAVTDSRPRGSRGSSPGHDATNERLRDDSVRRASSFTRGRCP